jgi:AraC family transcriptional regulator, positive regulator of tynA and feaB
MTTRLLHDFTRKSKNGALADWRETIENAGLGGSIQSEKPEEFRAFARIVLGENNRLLGFFRLSSYTWQKTKSDCSRFSRPGYSLTMVTAGSVAFEQHGRGHVIKAGSCFLRASHEPFFQMSSDDFECSAMHLSYEDALRWLPNPDDCTAIAISTRSAWGTALTASMQALDENSFDGNIVPAFAVTEQIGSLLALSLDRPSESTSTYKAGIVKRLLSLTLEYSCDASFSPRKLAILAGISLRNVHGVFASTGTTFGRTLCHIRLKRAMDYLNNASFDRKHISEIAHLVGYRSSSLFIRHFRHSYGISPAAYRKVRQGKR